MMCKNPEEPPKHSLQFEEVAVQADRDIGIIQPWHVFEIGVDRRTCRIQRRTKRAASGPQHILKYSGVSSSWEGLVMARRTMCLVRLELCTRMLYRPWGLNVKKALGNNRRCASKQAGILSHA